MKAYHSNIFATGFCSCAVLVHAIAREDGMALINLGLVALNALCIWACVKAEGEK